MWFKNLSLYRFVQPFAWDAEALDARLAARAFRPVAELELSFTGWVSPLGGERPPGVHAAGGHLMLCARKEEKVMPAAAVRDAVDARAREIEQREGRPVRGRRRGEIKDDVVFEMLPRAFTRSGTTFAWIDPGEGWLVVDAASPRKAEELLSLLRETLDTLPVVPLTVATAPPAVMTGWLTTGEIPAGLQVEDECDLLDPGEDRGTVRVRRQDLGSDEIRTHLDAGKLVTQLSLTFEDRLSFVLDQRLTLKRLKFLDMIQEAAREVDAESAAERFDADFAVMTLELARFLPRLVDAFGGEARREP
ncbi:MAG: recombination-associated protein RdgC [Gammaproteobacteria bacterium]|jgi:recombination associated protein RdgC|nr:recombination-associated protein RdgC [Gammaproteobacteria bacterium]